MSIEEKNINNIGIDQMYDVSKTTDDITMPKPSQVTRLSINEQSTFQHNSSIFNNGLFSTDDE